MLNCGSRRKSNLFYFCGDSPECSVFVAGLMRTWSWRLQPCKTLSLHRYYIISIYPRATFCGIDLWKKMSLSDVSNMNNNSGLLLTFLRLYSQTSEKSLNIIILFSALVLQMVIYFKSFISKLYWIIWPTILHCSVYAGSDEYLSLRTLNIGSWHFLFTTGQTGNTLVSQMYNKSFIYILKWI